MSSMMKMNTRMMRSTALRLAAFVALIVVALNTAIFTGLYISISHQLAAHLRAHIDEVRKTLIDVEGEETDGFQELSAMVEGHARVAQSDEDIYFLTNEAGDRVAGNVTSLQRFDDWRAIPWQDLKLLGNWPPPRSSDAVIGRWTKIRGGYLFVGNGNGDIRDAQRLLMDGLVWGIGLSVIFAILAGWLLGLRAQRRILQMEEALDSVASGALERRVPSAATADDIDHVAALINAMLERLQQLFRNLQQISVDIAHDLRTPITRMRHKLEIVRAGPDDVEAYKRTTDASIEEIDNIAETFNSMLRISEIEAGARKGKFVEIELNELLVNITDALDAVAEERGHQLHPPTPAAPMVVQGDRRLLNQLFLNLIENAILHCSDPAVIRVETAELNGHPLVRVRDTGPGIPPDEREKVFRRLYRLEKSRTTAGHGLGLSLVTAIAQLHGAKVRLSDNAPGLVVEVAFAKP